MVNIKSDILFKTIHVLPTTSNATLFVMDSKFNLFAHTDSALLYQPLGFSQRIKDKITELDSGFLVDSVKNSDSSVIWVKSALNNWKYVAVVPGNIFNNKLLVIRTISIVLISLFIILGIIGNGIITHRLYKPIRTLVKATKDLFDIKDKNINDQSVMSIVIPDLSGKAGQIKQSLQENTEMIRNKIVLDILTGNVKDVKDLNERLSAINSQMDFNCFCVLVHDMNLEQIKHLTFEQKEYLIYSLIDIISSHLSMNCSSLSASTMNNCIATIVNFPEPVHILNVLPVIIKDTESRLGIHVNIAAGSQVFNPLELFKIYVETEGYLKYRFIYGYGNIFTAGKVDCWERNTNTRGYEDYLSVKMDSLLRKSINEDIQNELSTLITDIQNQGFSYAFVRNLLLNIAVLINKNVREHGVMLEDSDTNGIYGKFKCIESIHDYFSWIHTIISMYSEQINKKNHAAHNKNMALTIGDYILSNIDKQISLNTVAEQLNISPWYLSKIFKDVTGSSFSDYIIDKKLNKASELLLTEKTDIAEVAARLGYYNLPYFAKIFKERYGITPTQYRKRNNQGGAFHA